nr:MAG TPA: homing endonuclease [Caudoviricetes sp.]
MELQELYNSKFRYESGELYWRIEGGSGKSKHYPGDLVGSKRQDGYYTVWVDGTPTLRHRVIWIMHNGPIPEGLVINHINGVVGDDRLENLELCTQKENTSIHKRKNLASTNTSGYNGVHFHKVWKRWTACVTKDGEQIFLGAYDTKEEANAARIEFEKNGTVVRKDKRRDNKSGIVGVCWDSKDNKWKAQAFQWGKVIYLGCYDDFFEACCARKGAENRKAKGIPL